MARHMETELYKEILIKMLNEEAISITFPGLDIEKLMHDKCYMALSEIRDIIRDETLEDEYCFKKIEEIICIYEKLGSDGGIRHDFG